MRLICPIRKIAVSALPEEKVRVWLLHELIYRLGYPSSSIAVEKDLSLIPHLRLRNDLPRRRADIICFAKGIHPNESLYPLLLIECKAVKLTPRMVNQVIGYNYYLQAPFLALVNHEEMRMGWMESENQSYRFIPHLLPYKDLIRSLQGRCLHP